MWLDFSQHINPESFSSNNAFEEKVLAFLVDWYSETSKVSVQTSGSTGKPKIFDIEKEKMQNSAKMTCDFLGLQEGNSALLCLPVEYISGKMMIVRAIGRKLKIKVVEPSIHPLENITENIDFCALTPLQVENSLEKIHLIKQIIIGGASVSGALKTKIKEVLRPKTLHNLKIFETYGMSETLSHIALKEIFPTPEEYFSVFDGIEIGTDHRGCLNIKAPQLNPETLQTNDVVEILGNNQFKFIGRADDVINSGGAKIYPQKLEDFVKKTVPYEVVFLGLDDEVLGQKLVGIVEASENESLKDQIISLPYHKSFERPKDVFFIQKIPRTPNGKVNRQELKRLINKSKS